MIRRLLLTTALVAACAAPAMAEDFTKEQLEQIIHDYIMKNPQVLIDSVNAYDLKQRNEADDKAAGEIKKNSDWLYKNKDHFEAGNPKGDITIVEFFDYNCGYCKQALNDILTILDEDKNVRLIFVEIPILGDSSTEAARFALAAGKQGGYLEYHSALMRHKGQLTTPVMEDYAKKAGLDVDRLKADMLDPKYRRIIDENLEKARAFGISGTPAFIIGDHIVRGYVGLDGLRAALKDIRAEKQ